MSDIAYAEEGIVALLERNEGVTAIAAADCIFPVAVPVSKTHPYIVYRRVEVRPASLDLDNRQYEAKMSLSCSADSYAGVRALAEAVKHALIGEKFRDGKYEIDTIELLSEEDGYDPPLPGRTKPLYDVELEFDYSYEELTDGI